MISGKRTTVLPKQEKYTYKIDSFNTIDAKSEQGKLDVSVATYGYNVKLEDGCIKNANGISSPIIVASDGSNVQILDRIGQIRIVKTYLFRRFDYAQNRQDDKIILIGENKKAYVGDVGGNQYSEITGLTFTDTDVQFVSYYYSGRDVVIMTSSGAGEMYLYDVNHIVVASMAPAMKSVCIHAERLFGVSATSAHTINFSVQLNPADWEATRGSGSISLLDEGGAIKKLVSFKGYLFIFREHAVHRMSAYGNPSDYSIVKVFETDDYIYPETIASSSDKIIFMAGNKLYAFDGYSATEFGDKVMPITNDNAHATGLLFKSTYYLATHIKSVFGERVGDEDGNSIVYNNALLTFDLITGAIGIMRGIDISYLTPFVTGKSTVVMVCFNHISRNRRFAMLDDSGTIYRSTILPKLWMGAKTALNKPEKIKAVKKVYLKSEYPVTVTIESDEKLTSKTYIGGAITEKQSFRVVGDNVSISFYTANGSIMVSNMMLEIDTIARYYDGE